MPNLEWSHGPEYDAAKEAALPKIPITHTILVPALKKYFKKYLLQCLLAEIEIYKLFPKTEAEYKPQELEPRDHHTCLMGQTFKNGGGNGLGTECWHSAHLRDYRRKVGTINHPVWGNCTVLEIWAADHFEKYPKMVREVHMYAYGELEKLPKIKFEVMPFILTDETGKIVKGKDALAQEAAREEQQKDYEDMLLEGMKARMRKRSRKR